MREALPWLVVAGLIVFGRPRPPASDRSSTSTPRRPAPAPPPAPLVAYLYQLPADGYETVRLGVAREPGGRPEERGIFSNPAAALKVIKDSGWALGWPDVRQLKERP